MILLLLLLLLLLIASVWFELCTLRLVLRRRRRVVIVEHRTVHSCASAPPQSDSGQSLGGRSELSRASSKRDDSDARGRH